MKTNTHPLFFSMTFEFLEVFLPEQMGRSMHTVESLRDTLTLFRRFINTNIGMKIENFTFEMCNRDCIFDFLDYLKKKDNSPATINHRLAGIKSYLNYASDVNVALQSVSLEVKRVYPLREYKKEKEILSVDDCSCIFSQPSNTKMGLRVRTFMILLYETACRVSELLNLKVEQLHHLEGDTPFVHVLGKGNKERYIAITKSTASHIIQYLSVFHPNECTKDTLLFYVTIKKITNAMSTRNVERFISEYAAMARKERPSIPLKTHPHMFRRSKATTLYQNGTPLPLVSSFLGHSQLETTRIYTKPSIKMLRTAIESVETPEQRLEKPLWKEKEEELAKMCGLR